MDKVGILVGPRSSGSNMAALIEACQSGSVPAEIAVVVATKEDAPALDRARRSGVAAVHLPYDDSFGPRLSEALAECRWLCLAGFLRKVPTQVLEQFQERVLNIHPALLPKFGGKGMYGHHVHEAVIAAGERESGCTVHLVTEEYDEGAILLQKRCPVFPDDTAEELATRVLALEHQAYPEALATAIARSRRP